MRYFAFTYKEYNDGTDPKTVLHTYDNIESAISEVHTNYGQNVGADTISMIMVTVLNSVGGQLKEHTLYWSAPVTTTETTDE